MALHHAHGFGAVMTAGKQQARYLRALPLARLSELDWLLCPIVQYKAGHITFVDGQARVAGRGHSQVVAVDEVHDVRHDGVSRGLGRLAHHACTPTMPPSDRGSRSGTVPPDKSRHAPR